MAKLDKDALVLFCYKCGEVILWMDDKYTFWPTIKKGDIYGLQKKEKRKKVTFIKKEKS